MTILQFAKEQCANYQGDGSCLGIGIRDDGRQYSFGANPKCVLAAGEVCRYFEECVLPMGTERTTGRAAVFADTLDQIRKEYRLTTGSMATVAYKRICPQCKTKRLESRKQLCYECQELNLKSKRRERTRKHRSGVTQSHFSSVDNKPLTNGELRGSDAGQGSGQNGAT